MPALKNAEKKSLISQNIRLSRIGGAYNQHMDSAIQCCTRKLAEQERQRITDFIGKGKEEPTMKVSYNGFTGELFKLERRSMFTEVALYDLEIFDAGKNVAHSFYGVKQEDVKFLGGVVSFGG